LAKPARTEVVGAGFDQRFRAKAVNFLAKPARTKVVSVFTPYYLSYAPRRGSRREDASPTARFTTHHAPLLMNTSSSDPWIGRLIGDRQRYCLEQRIGAGGMGNVYLAMDTRLGQQVAIKLLRDTLAVSAPLRKRFEREAMLCAALKSDHIVDISDYGVTEEGYPFYVMEYLPGETLGQLLHREPKLPVERAIDITCQVCAGLQLAHQGVKIRREGVVTTSDPIQIVHRDLKPDNIFLIPTALGELVKILDFGIAKIRDEAAEFTNLTSSFLGTFRYSAPEQLQVEKNLDGRADIYSLGMILYEMLSGSDPFGFGTEARKTSGVSWGIAHTSQLPQPLRSQPGCECLSVELEAIVMCCLDKLPEQRFQSVVELSTALQSVLQTSLGNAASFGFPSGANSSQSNSSQSNSFQSNSEAIAPPTANFPATEGRHTPPSVAPPSSDRVYLTQTHIVDLHQHRSGELAPLHNRTDADLTRSQQASLSPVQTIPRQQDSGESRRKAKKNLWLLSSAGFVLGVAGVALVAVIFYLYFLLPQQKPPTPSPTNAPVSPQSLEPW
jgi:eukaryotic-like serine/threonine-protein kinase